MLVGAWFGIWKQLAVFGALVAVCKGQTANSVGSNRRNHLVNPRDPWTLKCPPLDKDISNDKLIISFSLNGAIWLKVDNGQRIINNKLTSFNEQVINGRNVMRVILNNYRYKFDIDERTGKFQMNIESVQESDMGLWQCLITVHRSDGHVEQLTSYGSLQIKGRNGFQRVAGSKQSIRKTGTGKSFETRGTYEVEHSDRSDLLSENSNKKNAGVSTCSLIGVICTAVLALLV